MKRRSGAFLAVGVCLIALSRPVEAQFATGQRYLGAHLGLSGVGSAVALGLDGEIAYNDRIGIGAWIDTWSFGQSFTVLGTTTNWSVRYLSFAGTGAYHFPVPSEPKLDPFLGVSLGYYVVTQSVDGTGTGAFGGSASRAFLGGFGGVRYKLSDMVSGVARLGVGASYLTVGIDVGL